ncbi:FtsB family cell division protein [Arcanobacterium phocae]|uniref:FtsB family cell division protein n=1 Tax=Arcanobacterium phocae TaxID=131112 RepID=UPI001C10308A|nr:septum formation initiator family protein [Arcanobacterium phocae]
MVRRPSHRSSSGKPGSFRVPKQQAQPMKPGAGRNNVKRKTRPTASSSRKTEPGARSRFTQEHHLVIEGQNTTHRISLRLASIVLFVLLAVLIVANPLTQYLAQQEDIRQAKAELALVKDRVKSLEEEKELWNDPAYIQSKARERLGFVMPGQTLYTTTDPQKGDATERLNARAEEVVRLRREQTPFFVTGWDSLDIAGQVGERKNPQHTPILNDDLPPESQDSTDTKDTKK